MISTMCFFSSFSSFASAHTATSYSYTAWHEATQASGWGFSGQAAPPEGPVEYSASDRTDKAVAPAKRIIPVSQLKRKLAL